MTGVNKGKRKSVTKIEQSQMKEKKRKRDVATPKKRNTARPLTDRSASRFVEEIERGKVTVHAAQAGTQAIWKQQTYKKHKARPKNKKREREEKKWENDRTIKAGRRTALQRCRKLAQRLIWYQKRRGEIKQDKVKQEWNKDNIASKKKLRLSRKVQKREKLNSKITRLNPKPANSTHTVKKKSTEKAQQHKLWEIKIFLKKAMYSSSCPRS